MILPLPRRNQRASGSDGATGTEPCDRSQAMIPGEANEGRSEALVDLLDP